MTGKAPLLTVARRLPAGGRLAGTLIARAPFVALRWEVRSRSRFDRSGLSLFAEYFQHSQSWR